jgi:hypothetical protein
VFLGHFGVAMAGKAAAPRPSLGTLVLAAQFADGIWPAMVLLGFEHVRIAPGITAATPLDFVWYPYSHSLLFDIGWGVLLGGAYFVVRRDVRGALLLGLLVVSHWVLDVISHRPDMPWWPGSGRVGLGLWNSVPATLGVEFLLFGWGAWLYSRRTRARDAVGRWSFIAFVAVLAALYVASAVGPPPPSVEVLVWTGLAGWLFVAWGYWIERHRALA